MLCVTFEDRDLEVEDRMCTPLFRVGLAEIVCALDHPIQHSPDALPGGIQLTMLVGADIAALTRVI